MSTTPKRYRLLKDLRFPGVAINAGTEYSSRYWAELFTEVLPEHIEAGLYSDWFAPITEETKEEICVYDLLGEAAAVLNAFCSFAKFDGKYSETSKHAKEIISIFEKLPVPENSQFAEPKKHECPHCGAWTSQPDSECWKNPAAPQPKQEVKPEWEIGLEHLGPKPKQEKKERVGEVSTRWLDEEKEKTVYVQLEEGKMKDVKMVIDLAMKDKDFMQLVYMRFSCSKFYSQSDIDQAERRGFEAAREVKGQQTANVCFFGSGEVEAWFPPKWKSWGDWEDARKKPQK